jgi:lysophospholipase L1-like esterase
MLRRTLAAFACAAAFQLALPAQQPSSDRWEEDIRAFEDDDAKNPKPTGGVVFIGSSSIRMWDLDRSFPGLDAINRGFGGSQMADSLRYAKRILLPLKPKIVVVYAGDNDINAGKSPEIVFADFTAFVALVHDALPATKIVFVAIKPSLRRWNLVVQMRRANYKVEKFASTHPLVEFVDIDTPMLGGDRRPRPELFVEDGLHMTWAGYEVWNAALEPFLR